MEAIEARHLWFTARSTTGFIRRCHGDLHLGNICLWEGKPVPFDALEFDEALATIDVGYDLAFLLMDLDRRAGRAAANRVMNRYVARNGDAAVVAGFPIFLSQRAMIRAHVLASAGQESAGGQESADYLAAAGTYLDPVTPVVIAIGGLQGTGKSTLARALAPEIGPAPGALVLRSDETRKRLHGLPPEARLPPSAYSPTANAATNEALVEQARVAAEAGHAVIVDATFLDPVVRVALERAVTEPEGGFLVSGCLRRCRCWSNALRRAAGMPPTRRSKYCAGRHRTIRAPVTGCKWTHATEWRRWTRFGVQLRGDGVVQMRVTREAG